MNLKTEDDARRYWCPFVRAVLYVDGDQENVTVPVVVNRAEETDFMPPNAKCFASDCMAWRWKRSVSRGNPRRAPDTGHSFDQSRGYCGLAGEP